MCVGQSDILQVSMMQDLKPFAGWDCWNEHICCWVMERKAELHKWGSYNNNNSLEKTHLTLFTSQTNNWLEYRGCYNKIKGKHICKGLKVTTTLACCVTALKWRLWLHLPGQIIIFSHNTLYRLEYQWCVSSHNNKWLSAPQSSRHHFPVRDTSRMSARWASSAAKFELPWPLWNTLFSLVVRLTLALNPNRCAIRG